MTYTKKKIVITADVPDGATHYEVFDGGLEWFNFDKNCLNRWSSFYEAWSPTHHTKREKYTELKPIEVIEQ